MPFTRAVPLSGLRRVVRIRRAVVLPAPFGPSNPKTVPALDVQIDATKRLDRAIALPKGHGLYRGCGHLFTLAKSDSPTSSTTPSSARRPTDRQAP